jgi:CheY-like chemotaxis protein
MTERRRILLIEDDPGDRDLVAAYLERTDYALQSAEGGTLGVSLATAEPPDLILLDLSLPDMDGYQVCRLLREEPRTQMVPVVILTGSADPALPRQVYASGARTCIPKPVSRPTLLATLDGVLASQRHFPRVAVTCPVLARVPQFPGRDLRGIVRNVSRGGLLAEFSVELVPGSQLELTLETPQGPHHETGRVVWESASSDVVHHGIAFLEPKGPGFRPDLLFGVSDAASSNDP